MHPQRREETYQSGERTLTYINPPEFFHGLSNGLFDLVLLRDVRMDRYAFGAVFLDGFFASLESLLVVDVYQSDSFGALFSERHGDGVT